MPLHVAGVGRLVVTSKERLSGETGSSGSGGGGGGRGGVQAAAAAAAAAATAVLCGSDAARLVRAAQSSRCCFVGCALLRRLLLNGMGAL